MSSMSFDELASDYDAIVKPKVDFEQKYKKKLPVVFGPITDKNVEQVKSQTRSTSRT
jgi:hypothetical protein